VVHGRLFADPIAVLGVAGFVLLGVGLIYLVFGFGLLEIGWWALGHLRTQLTQILTLLARTLPVLLILVVFLLFASELWQAAHMLGGADLIAIIVLLLLVASLLVVTRARAEIGRLEETERTGDAVATRLAGTPAEPLLGPCWRRLHRDGCAGWSASTWFSSCCSASSSSRCSWACS
jgi:hypothetical protein